MKEINLPIKLKKDDKIIAYYWGKHREEYDNTNNINVNMI